MRRKAGYYWEKYYPYAAFVCVLIIVYTNKINFIDNENLPDALDSVNTICSLIIGFLGAILPVILGMKNESKIVKYVFEKDRDKLFLKYIKETIFWGLVTLLVTTMLYFQSDAEYHSVFSMLFYVWAALIILFLLLTFRSTSRMLSLIFSDDSVLRGASYEISQAERMEKEEIQKRFTKGQE